MTDTQITAWQQYGLIVDLAKKMHDNGNFLGKTALQKLVYFLQELRNVDCGYEFTMYTYGPFSSPLLGDLDITRSLGGVEIIYEPASGGHHILPGEESETLQKKASPFLNTHSDAINSVIEEFGGLNAKDLELRATLIYVQRSGSTDSVGNVGDKLFESVKELKPYFDDEIIRGAMKDLLDRRYLKGKSQPLFAIAR